MSAECLKKYNTHPFPEDDTSYLKLFDIDRYNKKYWLYKTIEGWTIKGVIRHINKDGSKRIFQFSYDGNKFVNVTKHIKNCPPLHADKLQKLDQDHQIRFGEGEKVADAMQAYFPDAFCTTWSGGCKNWRKTDWSVLRGFTDVVIAPDADKGGVDAAEEIAWHLDEEYGVKARVIDLPNTLPIGWDFADEIPDGINISKLIENAKAPDKRSGWENIDDDIARKRLVYIIDSLKLYWDRDNRKMMKEQNINLLYKRNRTRLRVTPVAYLHEQGIECVDGTAYWPSDDEIIRDGSLTFLNTFRPNYIAPVVNVDMNLIANIRNHMKHVLCAGDEATFAYLEDTLSFDFQYPERNRTFAWIFSSAQGVGKTLMFHFLNKCYGKHNCAWVHTDNLVDKYRSFMKSCYVIFCNEIDISGAGNGQKLDKLKELITEDMHPIEQKYVDTINHKGHFRLWASSNKHIPIKPESSDRRIAFVIIRITREQLLKDDPDYFNKLWADVENDEVIKHFYNYYKNREISPSFNPNEPINTTSREELIQIARPQAFKELDDLLKQRSGVFDRDIVNTRDILNHLRYLDDQRADNKQRPRYDRFDEMTIHRWLENIGAKPIWNNQPVSIIGNKKTNRKRYKAIRNIDYWVTCSEITYMRAHMRYKFEVGDATSATDLAADVELHTEGNGTLASKAHVPFVSETPEDPY